MSDDELSNYTTAQKFIYGLTFAAGYILVILISIIQGPVFPPVAEAKGLTAAEYGIVFGIFFLTMFFACLFLGKYISFIGVKKSLALGVWLAALASTAFGLAGYIGPKYVFLVACIGIRIVESCGSSLYFTAIYTIIMETFTESVGQMFSYTEVCFSIGSFVGPVIGGALFAAGGFVLPFATLGALLAVLGIILLYILPLMPKSEKTRIPEEKPSVLNALKIPSVCIAAFSVFCSCNGEGFLQATLSKHLDSLDMTIIGESSMFVIMGVCYGVSAPLYGYLGNKYSPKYVAMFGVVLSTIGYSLIGPLPFLPLQKSIGLIVIGLIFAGFGDAAESVSGFVYAHKKAIEHGLPDSTETYGLVSSLWLMSYSLGNFFGPTIGGILTTEVGFALGMFYVIGLQLLLFSSFLVLCVCQSQSCCTPDVRKMLYSKTPFPPSPQTSRSGSSSETETLLPKENGTVVVMN